ncbi:MAG: ScpA family protein [Patescibacteria group bacterium]
MATDFTIKVGDFEGPFEMLLFLIEKHKLHISQVSLAKVADDYVVYLRELEHKPMSEMANFILVASTLMLIKSLSLLPGLTLTPEETESIDDLERRLKHYQRIKDLTGDLKERFGSQIIFEREPSRERPVVFTPSPEISLRSLVLALKGALANLPKIEKLPAAIVKKVISLEEVMEDLAKRVARQMSFKFKDYVGEKKHERVNVIVSFLGILELFKQGLVEVRQAADFEDIDIETRQAGVPRY